MASCSNKPDRRHLLSIIGGDTIHLHKLEIPTQFVRFHGDGLSRVVMLKVPTGARWPVEIVKRNGQVWFQKGWREFAKYYSLVEGSSLVFEYEKIRASSQFNVIIYDKNMMEIRYNISFDHGDFSDSDDEGRVFGENVVVDEADSDSSLQILGSKSNLDGQAQEQRVNQSFTRKKASTKAEKAKAIYIQSEENSKRLKHKGMSSLKDFTSVNPYFQVKLSKNLLLQSIVISIPASFMKKCKNRSIEEAILQVENQVFHVKLLSYPKHNQFKLTGGVPEFIHGNCLREGDVCVFELIDSETMLIKVSIFRNT